MNEININLSKCFVKFVFLLMKNYIRVRAYNTTLDFPFAMHTDFGDYTEVFLKVITLQTTC